MLTELATFAGDKLGRDSAALSALRPAYAWWLRTAYGRRGVKWSVNGEHLRIDPRVRRMVPRESEQALFRFLRARVRRGDIILDIGSFLGVYAMLQARWSGPTGRVLAFEPFPSSFATMLRHLEMNGLRERVDARCTAVADWNGRRDLISFAGEPYRNMIADDVSSAPHVTVDVVTLDAACASLDRPPDVIRIDVQGLEFNVLHGARDLIRAGRGRTTIVAEMHPAEWLRYGVDAASVGDRLAELGLRAGSLTPGGDPFAQESHAVLEFLN